MRRSLVRRRYRPKAADFSAAILVGWKAEADVDAGITPCDAPLLFARKLAKIMKQPMRVLLEEFHEWGHIVQGSVISPVFQAEITASVYEGFWLRVHERLTTLYGGEAAHMLQRIRLFMPGKYT